MRLLSIPFFIFVISIPIQAFSAEGDFDLTYNVYTKHYNKSTYYKRELGTRTYFENNNHIGFRYGLNDYLSVGGSYGKNSFKQNSWVAAVQLTHPVTKYMDAGVMAGLSSGYEAVTDNGIIAVGGPTLRLKTPYVGLTVVAYAMSALVVTVDLPISTSLR